ncbi:uncharacterized protein Z519_04655 [Cladophialophora bantiana CBS 173.52]|uniref:Uncharacterized protein n=1 Tax=Cladophialophora bantiana (strain ATCC 10958 / CBS 173.52 / CDC B-1940 / NIH 8579) TaxID=1442370 RepID=A0A0D2HMS9_CLAB1|nr:uncharacterized protein Z519_04655 [Cladophialophora bantiana CBS 173.52]KIW94678.1 hypothetical protein Z519_04655 [Cladophialophora bantiana CBS 173.52]
MLHSETSPFPSALVLGLYVLGMKADADAPTRENSYEPLADLDWWDLGDVAVEGSPYHGMGIDLLPEADVIAHKGDLTFDGIPLTGGYASARQILAHFANLLDDVGMWCSSDVCGVLYIIADALTEDGVDDRTNDPVVFQNY